MCLHSPARLYMDLNGIFCYTHHIALISLLQTSAFSSHLQLHLASAIFHSAWNTQNEVDLLDLQSKVSGLKVLKNYQNVSRKSQIWVVIAILNKSTALMFIFLTLLRTFLAENFHYSLIYYQCFTFLLLLQKYQIILLYLNTDSYTFFAFKYPFFH